MAIYPVSSPPARLQTHLLQYPLRPPYRPYTEEGFEKLRLKPKVKRLQAELAVEQGSGAGTLPKGAETITLRSARVDLRSSAAAGVLRNGRLFLMNIDEVRVGVGDVFLLFFRTS